MTEDSGFIQEDFVDVQEKLKIYAAGTLDPSVIVINFSHLDVILAALDIAVRQKPEPKTSAPQWRITEPGTLALVGSDNITVVHHGDGLFVVNWKGKPLPLEAVSLWSAQDLALRHYRAMREVGLETDPQT